METMQLWKVRWLLLRMVLWILKSGIQISSLHCKSEMHNFLPECIYMGFVCNFVIYFQFVGSYEPFLSGSETKENTEVCMSIYFYSQLSSTNWWTCWTIIILYCETFFSYLSVLEFQLQSLFLFPVVCQQGRAVDPRTPEHSGVEVPTPELFWGWILFWDWELSSGVVSPNAMRGQLCINIFVSYNYLANHMSFLYK